MECSRIGEPLMNAPSCFQKRSSARRVIMVFHGGKRGSIITQRSAEDGRNRDPGFVVEGQVDPNRRHVRSDCMIRSSGYRRV